MRELTDEKLAELEAMAKAATPGPWSFRERAAEDYMVGSIDYEWIAHVWHHEGDAAFIAATDPDTVLSLIAEVRRLRADLAAAQTEAARSWDAFWAALTALECVCPTMGDQPTCRAIDRMRKVLVETEGQS